MYILVLSMAMLFGPTCPTGCRVLTGTETPGAGKYTAMPMDIAAHGFADSTNGRVFAIHPVWSADREKRLKQSAYKRRNVTDGCINISPEDFAKLPKTRYTLYIK